MARPLRIEFAGAVYHVTSRGDRCEPIFSDDVDRLDLLTTVGEALRRFDAALLAYCLMGNHYHFVLQTRQANLSRLMRHVNGVYSQAFNRRHVKVGHLFQGRFKAIIVDTENYLLELCRYVELNPVRARLVRSPDEWMWSSYRAHVGLEPPPPWLNSEFVCTWLLGRDAEGIEDRQLAATLYADLVSQARDVRLWDRALRQQIYLGDDAFVARMQARGGVADGVSVEVPVEQRRPPQTATQWIVACTSRDEGLRQAHEVGGLTISAIAHELGLSVSRVSRLIARKVRRQI